MVIIAIVGNNFEELTDVNLKEMMFEQRMKEIENDITPFGFIEDHNEEDKFDEAVLEGDKMKGWKVNKDWQSPCLPRRCGACAMDVLQSIRFHLEPPAKQSLLA